MQKKNQNKLSREVRFLIDFGFQLCMMLFCTVMNGYRIIYSLGEIMKDKLPKKRYIGFGERFQKCGKNGNRFDVDISIFHSGFPQVITICKKYKTYCHSGACRKERGAENKEFKCNKCGRTFVRPLPHNCISGFVKYNIINYFKQEE